VVWTLGVIDELGSNDVATLSYYEEAAARRFRYARDRALYRTAHLLKRLVHSAVLGVDPKALVYRYDRAGKPHLVWPRSLPFSLSHGGQCVAVAISCHGSCGTDVEDQDAVASAPLDWPELLHARERQRLCGTRQLPPHTVSTLWTLKEAASKAIGLGFSLAPITIETPALQENTPYASDPSDLIVHGPRAYQLRATALSFPSQSDRAHRLAVAHSAPVSGFIFTLIEAVERQPIRMRCLFASDRPAQQIFARSSKTS
jgi:phosphopantetheinyl transferase